MEQFKTIIQLDNGNVCHKTVEGKRIIIENINCFIFKESEFDLNKHGYSSFYNISHLETGMKITSSPSRTDAITEATNYIAKDPKAIDKGIDRCKKLNIDLPVNK